MCHEVCFFFFSFYKMAKSKNKSGKRHKRQPSNQTYKVKQNVDEELNKLKSFALTEQQFEQSRTLQQKQVYLQKLKDQFRQQANQFSAIVQSIEKYIPPNVISRFKNTLDKDERKNLLEQLMKNKEFIDEQTKRFNTFRVTEKQKQEFANAETIEDRQNIINAISEENDFGSLTSTQKPQLSKKRKEIEAIKENISKIGDIQTDIPINYDDTILLNNLKEELDKKPEGLRGKDIIIHRCNDGFYKVIIDGFDVNCLGTLGLNEHCDFLLTDNEISINDIITKINNTDSCFYIEGGARISTDQHTKIIKSMYIITDKKDTNCTIRESVVQQYGVQFSKNSGDNIKLYLCLYDIK